MKGVGGAPAARRGNAPALWFAMVQRAPPFLRVSREAFEKPNAVATRRGDRRRWFKRADSSQIDGI